MPVHAQDVDDLWKSLMARGLNEDNAKDYAKAELTYLQALKEAERFGADDPRVATTETSLGLAYRHQKKFSEAESAYRRALGIIEKTNEPGSIDVADANLNLAAAMVGGGRTAAALPVIQKALDVYESEVGGFHQKTADALCLEGDAYRLQKSYLEAEQPLRRCADIRQSNGGMSDLAFAEALHGLALAYMGSGKYALAEPRFTLAEKIREKNLGITSPLLAETMEDHAALLKKLGRDTEAARLNAMAAAILKTNKK
ncbi:MAG TPA: tetratricopeptide repeat protein [Bryobacteraceae bacterium]|nr:tetratricopeptide repeat protein [Bryobacteraceae bacterium]